MPAKRTAKRRGEAKTFPARTSALKRWARYRAERATAEERGKAIVENAEFSKGRDRLWSVKSEIGGRKVKKAGFRTKAGAKLWLQAQARAFVLAQKAKALSALPSRDKTIAKAFEITE